MSITAEKTKELIAEYGGSNKNTGATEAQIAILTERIRNITDHLKTNKKDHSGRRGLIILVAKRRRLLNYLKKGSIQSYVDLIAKLGIRK
jgi:small subunit ribosomal protein S15